MAISETLSWGRFSEDRDRLPYEAELVAAAPMVDRPAKALEVVLRARAVKERRLARETDRASGRGGLDSEEAGIATVVEDASDAVGGGTTTEGRRSGMEVAVVLTPSEGEDEEEDEAAAAAAAGGEEEEKKEAEKDEADGSAGRGEGDTEEDPSR